jgi:hypothetical protein
MHRCAAGVIVDDSTRSLSPISLCALLSIVVCSTQCQGQSAEVASDSGARPPRTDVDSSTDGGRQQTDAQGEAGLPPDEASDFTNRDAGQAPTSQEIPEAGATCAEQDAGDGEGVDLSQDASGHTCSDQPGRIEWVRSYFNREFNYFTAMNQMARGSSGLIVSGRMATSAGSAGWVAKLDDKKEVVWEDLILPSTAECRVLPLRDGGLFAGCTITVDCPPGVNYHDCDRDILFRRYAPSGEVVWEDLFGGETNKGNDGTSGGFVELNNGNVVVPYDFSTPNGSSDTSIGHLRGYSATGQQVWDREVNVPTYSSVNLSSMVGAADRTALYARAGTSDERASIVKFHTMGELSWATPTQDGRSLYKVGLVGERVAAVGSETFESERRAVVEVFSSDGVSELVKYFSAGDGGRATANAVAGTPEGRLFVAVTAEASGDTVAKAFVVELGNGGEELWRTESFGPSLSTIVNLAVDGKCGLLAAGRRWEDIEGETRDVAFGAGIGL